MCAEARTAPQQTRRAATGRLARVSGRVCAAASVETTVDMALLRAMFLCLRGVSHRVRAANLAPLAGESRVCAGALLCARTPDCLRRLLTAMCS